jgi:hypothetical protein
MCLQPLRHGGNLPIRQQSKGAPSFEITHERAIGVTLPECEIVYAEDLGYGKRWGRKPADYAQQGIAADREA